MIRDTSGQDRVLTKPALVNRRRVSVIFVGVMLALGLAYVVRGWVRSQRSVDRSRVRIAKVHRGTLVRDVIADGRVVAANSPTLYAIAPGIVDFRVHAGDAVKRGQIIATIASPELESRLAQEQATLAGLQAGVGRAGLDIEHGQASGNKLVAQAAVDVQTAQREVDINRTLYAKGVIAELELRRSEDILEKANIALKDARIEAGLGTKELEFDLGTKQQALDRQQEVVHDLERQVAALQIQSPVDGQIGQLLVAQRTSVAANQGVLTVIDLGAFELEIHVADGFARDLGIGMAAEIREGTQTFPGKVRSVSPEVVDGNVATRIEFSGQLPNGLRQNQRLTARILIDERPNVLEVERGAFADASGGNYAYFVDGDVAERRPIKIGATSLDQVELLSGAHEGDEIVVTGADAFGDAQRVRLSD
ncbi:MAG TPA: HlyD family efflux transporter periplasmic adaptor subunit [Kofleriaceae bacterium]|jgi:HlyD family secretion protein